MRKWIRRNVPYFFNFQRPDATCPRARAVDCRENHTKVYKSQAAAQFVWHRVVTS